MSVEEILVYRFIGSVGGAVIASAIIQPNRFPLRRIIVSIFSGMMGTPVLMRYLGWPIELDLIVAGACFVSFSAWQSWHAVIMALEAEWFKGWLKRKLS